MANSVSNFFHNASLRAQGRDPTEQAMKIKQMQALLESEKGRKLVLDSQAAMNEARTGALNRGEGYYGGGKKAQEQPTMFDDMAEYTKNRKTLDAWYDEKVGEKDELSPSDQAKYNAALEKLEPERTQQAHGPNVPGMPEVSRQYFEQQKGQKKDGFVGPPAPKASEYFTPDDSFVGPPAPSDSPAELLYEAPRTYEQMGIENVDDMATLQEMQEALPDRDMKAEYEADPELMQKLIQLWREKKLTKQNLHKAFSVIQQRAREALS